MDCLVETKINGFVYNEHFMKANFYRSVMHDSNITIEFTNVFLQTIVLFFNFKNGLYLSKTNSEIYVHPDNGKYSLAGYINLLNKVENKYESIRLIDKNYKLYLQKELCFFNQYNEYTMDKLYFNLDVYIDQTLLANTSNKELHKEYKKFNNMVQTSNEHLRLLNVEACISNMTLIKVNNNLSEIIDTFASNVKPMNNTVKILLLNKHNYKTILRGISLFGKTCSGYIVMLYTNDSSLSSTLSHEIAHSLGIDHDDKWCKCSVPKNKKCLMYYAYSTSRSTMFSNCSIDSFKNSLHSLPNCHSNKIEYDFISNEKDLIPKDIFTNSDSQFVIPTTEYTIQSCGYNKYYILDKCISIENICPLFDANEYILYNSVLRCITKNISIKLESHSNILYYLSLIVIILLCILIKKIYDYVK